MSNFFLCDMCDVPHHVTMPTEHDPSVFGVSCKECGSIPVKVMYDYGKDHPSGIYGYLDPLDVCVHFKPRE